jgi:hypothetical protein
MGKLQSTLTLDKEYLCKPTAYYLYRSHEAANDQPVISGVYIQRASMGQCPPEKVQLSLEWAGDEAAAG